MKKRKMMHNGNSKDSKTKKSKKEEMLVEIKKENLIQEVQQMKFGPQEVGDPYATRSKSARRKITQMVNFIVAQASAKRLKFENLWKPLHPFWIQGQEQQVNTNNKNFASTFLRQLRNNDNGPTSGIWEDEYAATESRSYSALMLGMWLGKNRHDLSEVVLDKISNKQSFSEIEEWVLEEDKNCEKWIVQFGKEYFCHKLFDQIAMKQGLQNWIILLFLSGELITSKLNLIQNHNHLQNSFFFAVNEKQEMYLIPRDAKVHKNKIPVQLFIGHRERKTELQAAPEYIYPYFKGIISQWSTENVLQLYMDTIQDLIFSLDFPHVLWHLIMEYWLLAFASQTNLSPLVCGNMHFSVLL